MVHCCHCYCHISQSNHTTAAYTQTDWEENILSCTFESDEDQMPDHHRCLGLRYPHLAAEDFKVVCQRRRRRKEKS